MTQRSLSLSVALGLSCVLWNGSATAEQSTPLSPAPSTVQDLYVEPSATRALLPGEKVAHLPDLVNPDQPPFWAFAGSDDFAYYEANLEQMAKLDWAYLHGGHGNIGARADVEFYRMFLADLKQAVGKALGEVAWGTGVDAANVNAHTPFLPAWLNAVSMNATASLRPKYGGYYGFEAATPRNAEMVARSMFSYK